MSKQVILMDDVEHLGKIGDTVTVRDGYARNFLLPKGLAEPVTKNALRKLDKIRKEREELLKIRRAEAMDKAGKLRGQTLTIAVKAIEGDETGKLYGSVTAADIAKALTEAGVAVDAAMVKLPEPSPSSSPSSPSEDRPGDGIPKRPRPWRGLFRAPTPSGCARRCAARPAARPGGRVGRRFGIMWRTRRNRWFIS